MRNKLINHLSTNYGNYLMILAVCIIILLGALRTKAQTPQEVYNLCVQLEIKHPEIVVKQSILETKWYGCDKCSLRYNNIFGFRKSSKATKENPLGYFKFADWKRCVYFYKLWQSKFYQGNDYYEFLSEISYAQNMNTYIFKLKTIELKI